MSKNSAVRVDLAFRRFRIALARHLHQGGSAQEAADWLVAALTTITPEMDTEVRTIIDEHSLCTGFKLGQFPTIADDGESAATENDYPGIADEAGAGNQTTAPL